jgi:hypothetical protein
VAIELDEWDKAWLAQQHTPEEWRRECESALLRCAAYSARIDRLEAELEQLRGQRAGCRYPACLDGGGRCHAMFAGECAGPKQERTTI